jgi:hypothetical protein
MTRFWNKQDIPHKGWMLIDCIDTKVADNICDMCDKENIRYVHKMYHPEEPEYLNVGCICAGHMTSPYVAEEAERKTRNKTMHKKKWMTDGWNIKPIDNNTNNNNTYQYKSIRKSPCKGPWGVYELSDGWHYNVVYSHSIESFATKELALQELYKIYRQLYFKEKP